jgi:hypothetical protein
MLIETYTFIGCTENVARPSNMRDISELQQHTSREVFQQEGWGV